MLWKQIKQAGNGGGGLTGKVDILVEFSQKEDPRQGVE